MIALLAGPALAPVALLLLAGIAALLWGSYSLYDGAWWMALGTLLATGGIFYLATRLAMKSLRRPRMIGGEALVGKAGKARSALAPEGTVLVGSEEWSAVAEGGAVAEGEAIEVLAQEGNKLKVRRKH